jgi:polyketide biosynthesis 3-hydroxy-3-methylglutaryl-CoA synthase-like enzyme PksG
MLVSNDARTLVVDQGANGYWSFEVMDTLRPRPDVEAGDSDLSLLSYMSCLEQAYLHYDEVVDGADLRTTFDHLAFHTPFAGMVKAAHKRLMSKTCRLDQRGIEEDFVRRVASSIEFCKKVGNVYSAALYLALCSLLEGFHGDDPARVGLFSYGSGCASEFYSGVVRPDGARALQSLGISAAIADRADLSMADYDSISDLSLERLAGVKDLIPDRSAYAHIYADKFAGAGLLVLDRISNFHRSYAWS